MRYHFEKPEIYSTMYGRNYICNHPVYNSCTLFEMEGKGLAVIQQRFDPEHKSTYWTEIDPWLADTLYLNPGFKKFFDQKSRKAINGLFPTITIRQFMWALKMKPISRERWETTFDHSPI